VAYLRSGTYAVVLVGGGIAAAAHVLVVQPLYFVIAVVCIGDAILRRVRRRRG